MVDQISSVNTCRKCGALLADDAESPGNLCPNCLSAQEDSASLDAWLASGKQESVEHGAGYQPQPEGPPDPDKPWWGPVTGIGVWLFSVAAILVIPSLAAIAWYFYEKASGLPVPVDRDGLIEWATTPRLLLLQLVTTFIAHIITLAFCWTIVTRMRKAPFLKSLGWHWAGRSPMFWILFSVGVVIAIIAADQVFLRILPQREDTPFDLLLKRGQAVRIALAITATFSAPLVEEVIYRGVLFAGLRRYLGSGATVFAVTILFAGIHIFQYWGAWASFTGLILLSLVLTVLRAKTKSILPCVLVHFVNNGLVSTLIVLNKV